MNMIQKNTFKIINFLIRSIEQYNINQTARLLEISVGSAYKILKSLEERKIVSTKELGNAIYYNLNLENDEAVKLAELVLIEDKTNIIKGNPTAKVYAQDLERYDAECIVLFGSILYKNEQAKDVDVLFIIKDKRHVKMINQFCLDISRIRTKAIHPLIMLERDFTNNIKIKNNATIDIIKRGMVLRGQNVFINAIKNAR